MRELKWKESGVDVANLVVGTLLFLTPWLFGFVSDQPAAPNAWISGILIGVVAIAALAKFAEWEEWVNLLLGAWVLASPWLLSFATHTTGRWVHVIAGVIVAALAAAKLWFLHQSPPRLAA